MELDLDATKDNSENPKRIIRLGENETVSRSNVILLDESRLPGTRKFASLESTRQEMEAQNPWTTNNVGYVCRSLVQATLPYREPKGNPQAWGRTNGKFSLVIQPGQYLRNIDVHTPKGVKQEIEAVSIGYPYGSIPRLLLAWIGKEVKIHKKRDIELGSNLVSFMAEIGLTSVSGGKNGSITRLKEQMRRLFMSRISITDNVDAVTHKFSSESFNIADKQNIWWDSDSFRDQPGLFTSSICLSERFFEELNDSPVPLDMRALRELKSSPTALDLYCYLTWSMFRLEHDRLIDWTQLKNQFGAEVGELAKFTFQFKKALAAVKVVYPEANVHATKEGLVLRKSPTSVPVRSVTKIAS